MTNSDILQLQKHNAALVKENLTLTRDNEELRMENERLKNTHENTEEDKRCLECVYLKNSKREEPCISCKWILLGGESDNWKRAGI